MTTIAVCELLFRVGDKLALVSPDKVYVLLLIEREKNTLSKLEHVYAKT